MSGEPRGGGVTGAPPGLGRRPAEVLAGEGYALGLVDLRDPDGPPGSLALVGDVSSEEAVDGFATEVARRFGRVDVLVNNAGISMIEPAEETTLEQWRRV